jgi:hypothetical protein
MLAINTTEAGRNIVLRSVGTDGRIGAEVAAFGVAVGGKPVRRVGRVEWHPSGRFLALGLSFEDEIRFYRVTETGGRATIAPFGEPVKVGDFPDDGAFTPDGRHYISTDLQWGDRMPPNYLNPPSGTLTAVRFDAEDGKHSVTGSAPTGISPEGIAISPDGRSVVAANLTRSFMPWGDSRLTMGGSLDLLAFDPETGTLRHIANYPIAGVLPEGLAFDASGHFLAATVFDRYDPRRRRGAVEFWRLIGGASPSWSAPTMSSKSHQDRTRCCWCPRLDLVVHIGEQLPCDGAHRRRARNSSDVFNVLCAVNTSHRGSNLPHLHRNLASKLRQRDGVL